MTCRGRTLAVASALALLLGFRCPGGDPTAAPPSVGTTGATGGAGGAMTASVGAGGVGGFVPPDGCEDAGPDEDVDEDGYTIATGDCDECNPRVNPSAIELPTSADGEPADEDCDGEVDEPVMTCEANQGTIEDPFVAAAVMGLCPLGAAGDESPLGLYAAEWVRADGTSLASPGLAAARTGGFGDVAKATAGSNMLVLSTGRAFDASNPNQACNDISCSTVGLGEPPAGFPQDPFGCGLDGVIADDIGLEVSLRVPSNVTGFRYDVAWLSFDYPEWVCHAHNDQFIALVEPPPSGSLGGNVTFDSNGMPLGALFEPMRYCDPASQIYFAAQCTAFICPQAPDPYCPGGPGFLVGTGFDEWGISAAANAGSTGWLRTMVPVERGSDVQIRFAIFDTGDTQWDSTVLLDGFRWLPGMNANAPVTSPLNP